MLLSVALLGTCLGLLLAPVYLLPAGLVLTLQAVSVACALLLRKFRCLLPPILLLFCFATTNARYPAAFPQAEFASQIGRIEHRLTVVAELEQLHHKAGGRSQLDLRLLQLYDRQQSLPVPENCRLRLFVDEPVESALPGDRFRFQARLRQPRLFGTPGEFLWPRYLASQGIALTGWLKQTAQLELLASVSAFPERQIAALKLNFANLIETAVGKPQSVHLRALLLGEGRLLPDELREKLAAAGVSHLFAISGLHLGLLALLGYRLLLFGYRRVPVLLLWQPPQRVVPLLLLPLLLVYLLLTGCAVSTQRAFALALLAAGLLLWRRAVNPLRLLLLLAFLFLWDNPLLLWQPAWQLSFAGAAGILLWCPLWQNRLQHLRPLLRGLLALLLVSAAATLATLPLVIGNFHLLAPASLLANLIAVPLVALLALPLGLSGLLLGGVPWLSGLCLKAAELLLQLVFWLLDRLLDLPLLDGHYLFWSPWQLLALTLVLLPGLLWFQPAWRRWRNGTLAVCLLLAVFCLWLGRPAERLRLYLFSVGQGESLLLVDRQGRAILVDGGGLYSEHFDVGKRLLAPALGALGIERLEAVLLSHDHPDHRKGLLFVLQQFPVGEFWTAAPLKQLNPALQQVLQQREVPVRQFGPGWTELAGRFSVGLQLYGGAAPRNRNDASLVLYLPLAQESLLLTGDLERRGVTELLQAGLPGPVGLLKLPHHGSRHSGTERLLRQLRPSACLVSAGYQNRYHFPAAELVEALARLRLPLYRTDLQGTVRAEWAAGRWQFSCWKNGLFR